MVLDERGVLVREVIVANENKGHEVISVEGSSCQELELLQPLLLSGIESPPEEPFSPRWHLGLIGICLLSVCVLATRLLVWSVLSARATLAVVVVTAAAIIRLLGLIQSRLFLVFVLLSRFRGRELVLDVLEVSRLSPFPQATRAIQLVTRRFSWLIDQARLLLISGFDTLRLVFQRRL